MPAAAGLTLHLLDLSVVADALERIEAGLRLLSPDERGEDFAATPRLTGTRRSARIALRLVLAASGVRAAFGVPFDREAGGKPVLAGSQVSFNLSHTGGHVLIALAGEGPVGVDIETRRTLSFSATRCAQIAAAARDVCVQAGAVADDVLIAWTALEAQAKAEGCGIGVLLAALGIMGPGSRTRSPDDIAATASLRRRDLSLAVSCLDVGGRGTLLGAVCAPARLLASAPAVPEPAAVENLTSWATQARQHLPVDHLPASRP